MFRHGLTYSGHATACARRQWRTSIFLRTNISSLVGLSWLPSFDQLAQDLANYTVVTEVRTGIGLLAGIQLTSPEIARAAAALCRERGVMIRVITNGTLQLSPSSIGRREERSARCSWRPPRSARSTRCRRNWRNSGLTLRTSKDLTRVRTRRPGIDGGGCQRRSEGPVEEVRSQSSDLLGSPTCERFSVCLIAVAVLFVLAVPSLANVASLSGGLITDRSHYQCTTDNPSRLRGIVPHHRIPLTMPNMLSHGR